MNGQQEPQQNDNNNNNEIDITTLLILGSFLLAVPLAIQGFLYILKIELSFFEVFIAFLLCTVGIKWFKAMWGGGNE